jgi:hypothetical protein
MGRAVHWNSRSYILALMHSVKCVLSNPFCGTRRKNSGGIYFKGLIAADTHPRDQMLNAIDGVRRRWASQTAKLSIKSVLELVS